MDFKLDENLPDLLVADLAALGHDAATCESEGITGATDPVVAIHFKQEKRILATFDLDFANIRRYPPGTHPGIVVFRLHSQDISNCQLAFHRMLSRFAEDDIRGNLVIVEETRVRIRRPD